MYPPGNQQFAAKRPKSSKRKISNRLPFPSIFYSFRECGYDPRQIQIGGKSSNISNAKRVDFTASGVQLQSKAVRGCGGCASQAKINHYTKWEMYLRLLTSKNNIPTEYNLYINLIYFNLTWKYPELTTWTNFQPSTQATSE